MPHFIVEYSENLASDMDVRAMMKQIADAAVSTGIFPLPGLRGRSYPAKDYWVADGHPDNAFLHLTIKMGHGRDIEARRRAAETIFKALCDFFADISARRPLALSMEMAEFHAELNFKHGNMSDHIAARRMKAAE